MTSDDGLNVLKQWAADGLASVIKLSSDGTKLSYNDKTIDATISYEMEFQGKKSASKYTLASIYLQIVDPDQSLMKYRGSCKKHGVKDPVKALDKPIIVGYVLGIDTTKRDEEGALPPIIDQPSASSSKRKERDEDRRDDSRHKERRKEKERDRDRRKSSSSSKDRARDAKLREKERIEEKKKRKKEGISNEQLFTHLTDVVAKRDVQDEKTDEEKKQDRDLAILRMMLSANGFMPPKDQIPKLKSQADAIMSNERPTGNSASILRAKSGGSFGRVLDLYNETIKPSKSSSKSKGSSSGKQSQKEHLVGKKPIIVVPKGMTSPITLLNAHEFFANCVFVPRDIQMKKVDKNSVPTTFKRRVGQRLGGGSVEYEIIDNPKVKLGADPKEWDRVVAVIALGAAWQFKDWPNKAYNNPVSLFDKAFGFYVGMEGTPYPADLKTWRVQKGTLSRDKRGLDSVTYASFWNGLDEWMSIHKAELLPRDEF